MPNAPSGQDQADPARNGTEPVAPVTDDVGTPGSGWAKSLPPLPCDTDIVRLRELLFSHEIALIDALRAALESREFTTQKVSEVLAEAVLVRSGKDPALSIALEPLVDAIVKASLGRRRDDFVDALFPLMGPTIRKSIAEGFRSMLGSFSKSMEMAFSWKGLKWRFEAWRSGKVFSEIVMLNTLVYRVEQLFFIHSDTGLVLSHLTGENVESQDADMVSAMLTAIQDFVRDCFSSGKKDTLQSLQMGEFTIYIEKAHRAYIACVIRGTPPADFHAHLRATLDLLLVEYEENLTAFSGDSEPFTGAYRYLEPCLLSHYADSDRPVPLWTKALLALLVILALGGAGYAWHAHAEAETARKLALAQEEAYAASLWQAVNRLRAEPGLMVASVTEEKMAPWETIVLKDSLARSPEEVLRDGGGDSSLLSVKTIPFISYDPSIVVLRVAKAIQPPDTVTMTFDEKGMLSFSGTAPMAWIVSTREEARAIPGVEHVDLAGVRDPMMDRITAMIREVESAVIEFPLGRDTPIPQDEPRLKKAVDTLVDLEKIAQGMGFTVTLTIYGHADSLGQEKRNYEISQARARTVAAMLYARGSSMPVAMYGMGSGYPRGDRDDDAPGGPGKGDQASRRIEMRVHFALSPSADPVMFRR